MTTPVDANDLPESADRGRPGHAVGRSDLGAAWTEASRSFVLDVPKLEIGGLAEGIRARLARQRAAAGIFAQPGAGDGAAAQIEAGTIELTVRDTGGVDLAVAQYARAQNVSREAARQAIVESIRPAASNAAANPDAVAAVQALARFIETPGQTLIIKLTPRGKVPAMQLFQLLKTDPLVALAQFRIEASTGL